MFRTKRPASIGGAVLGVTLLLAAIALQRLGIPFGEALYLAALVTVGLGYGVTAWRLRQGR